MIKLTIIGAGSAVFTKNIVVDLMHISQFKKMHISLMDIDEGLEIHHDGDLPARTGLGSSSSFSVGMLHTLFALKGIMPTRQQLAFDAIHLERDILKESVGSQDQVLASIGGFNRIDFFT